MRAEQSTHEAKLKAAAAKAFDLAAIGPDRNLAELLPENPKRAYDVHPIVDGVLDRDADVRLRREVEDRLRPHGVEDVVERLAAVRTGSAPRG